MAGEQQPDPVSVTVSNIGGIDRTTQQFESAITLLSGRNATNRTSFLQSIMAALGSDDVSLRASATEGYVELTVGEETYTRELTRVGDRGEVSFSGEPYTEDAEAADLFAFLLGDNRVRQHVRSGADELRDLVMQPVDTASINRQIRDLEAEISDLETTRDELERQHSNLPSLQREREELQEELSDIEDQITAKESEIEQLEVDLAESREQQAAFEEAMGELNSTREQLNQARDELEAERQSLSTLREDREEKAAELDSLGLSDIDESELRNRQNDLVGQRETLDEEIDQLAQVISFNRDLLEDQRSGITAQLQETRGTETPAELTEQLVDGGETVCWTCGQAVEADAIRETLDVLDSYRQEKLGERGELDAELSDIETRLERVRNERAERERLQQELDALEDRIETTERTIDSIQSRIDSLEADVADLESTVADLEVSDTHSQLIELHDELNDLQRERDAVRRRLDPVEEKIADAKAAQERIETVTEDLDTKRETLRDLRTRIERLEASAVETFNENMEDIIDILEYDNIARVWLERRQVERTEGRRTVEQSVFDLNVVREDDEGRVFTDRVEHLSESEREVVGLVVALAGYLAHEVYERVPFVLLDSLEAIDSERIAAVIDYFDDYAEYTIAALLPEDTAPAANLEETSTVISDI